MSRPDFNLLVVLDAVLSEGNVTRAARRLGLSPSAMSRALARLRETTGDPLLVRAGRGLIPTPRATLLQEQVHRLVQEVEEVLSPAAVLDLSHLSRTFTLRIREGFVENFGLDLIERVRKEAPGVRLSFVQKPDREGQALRDGTADLEIGVVGPATRPEVQVQALFRDRFIGVVRHGHPLTEGQVTPERFASGDHLGIARAGSDRDPISDSLKTLDLDRQVVAVVGDFAAALSLVAHADLIACVPGHHTRKLRRGLFSFELPFPAPEITVSMLWHPRLDADPAHRWLRGVMQQVCTKRGEGET